MQYNWFFIHLARALCSERLFWLTGTELRAAQSTVFAVSRDTVPENTMPSFLQLRTGYVSP